MMFFIQNLMIISFIMTAKGHMTIIIMWKIAKLLYRSVHN